MLLALAAHPLRVDAVGPGGDCITEAEPVSRDVADLVGDRDSFGYCDAGVGCGSFNWFEAADDAGNFDMSVTPTSSCDVAGSWTHTFTPPPGGVGSFTLRIPTVNSDSCGTCYEILCIGDNDEKLFVDEEDQPDFLGDALGCGIMKLYSRTFGGDEANRIAGDGSINVRWEQGGDEMALDYSEIVDLRGVVTVSVVSGNGQRGVIGSPVDEPLVVQLATLDPKINIAGFNVTFTVSSQPRTDSGAAIGGPADPLVATVAADAFGRASIGIRLGVDAGDYTVKARTANTLGDGASFTVAAEKPGEVRIQRGTGEATAAPVEREFVFFSEEPEYFAVGYDTGGVRIGAATCNWSTTAHGPASSQGAATLAPETECESTVFTPTKQGRLTLNADLNAGNGGGALDIVIPGLYLDIDGDFDPLNPTSDLAEFVPGSLLNGDSVVLTPTQPQVVYLHLLTKPGQDGFIPLSLSEVSHWEGIAMNYPAQGTGSFEADLSFANGTDSILLPIDASGHSVTPLLVKDYAAGGVLVVTLPGRGPHVVILERTIPVDDGPAGAGLVGNRLPDVGWQALTGEVGGVRQYLRVVESGLLLPDQDIDDQPLGTGAPEEGRVGDGLTALEEYRGFIVRGLHRRLHPSRKDFFYYREVEGDPYDDEVRRIPGVNHLLLDATEFGGTTTRVVNWNRAGMAGTFPQKGLHLRVRGMPRCSNNSNLLALSLFGYARLDGDTEDPTCPPTGVPRGPNHTEDVQIYPNFYRVVSYGENGVLESSGPICFHADVPGNPSDPPSGGICDPTIPHDNAFDEHQQVYSRHDYWQITLGGDDFFADTAGRCEVPPPPPPFGTTHFVTGSSRTLFFNKVAAHELGHGLACIHESSECQSIMADPANLLPLDFVFTPASAGQVRLHDNP